MHHDLDVHPIPKQPFYINEPTLIDPSLGYYDPERKIPADDLKDYKAAIKNHEFGKAHWFNRYEEDQSDNIRVYIPLDLNAEAILRRLGEIIGRYGAASEYNESDYSSEVNKIIAQLEIYDQVWFGREMREQSKGKCFALLRNYKTDGIDKAGRSAEEKENDSHSGSNEILHFPLSPDEHVHSQHGLELVKKVIKRLEDIPDACAECFPFETIDELNKEWFGIDTLTEPK